MTEVVGVGWLVVTESALWDQVKCEAVVAVKGGKVGVESTPGDSRGVLADFYEEYGLGLGGVNGGGLAGCLRWCVGHELLVHLSWFNAEVYGNGDANDLHPRLFRLLKGGGGETTSDYYRGYGSTKEAYLDLMQALESCGHLGTAKGW